MIPRARSQLLLGGWASALLACATLGSDGEGNRDLPTAGAGPFRKLTSDEVQGLAPFVFDSQPDRYREPGAIGDGEEVLLYVVAFDRGRGADVLVRTRARDARSFYGANVDTGHTAPVVMVADLPWEGPSLSGPSPLRVGAELWLYYAAAGGIGLARSDDGLVFRKEPGPVLGIAGASPWESGPPSAPSVVRSSDGVFHLFYATGCAIGEATSRDGLAFERTDPVPETPDPEPVLSVSLPRTDLLPGEKPPFDTSCVGDPSASIRTTVSGREHLRVLYTGFADGVSTIGFAARYGSLWPLSRNELPSFAPSLGERAPTTVEHDGRLFLYVEMQKKFDKDSFPAIGAGIAPATTTLGQAGKFPLDP